MISCSSNAGVVVRSGIRQRINSGSLNSLGGIESDNEMEFSLSPPSTRRFFILRHIYRYDRTSNSFNLLGCQRAQAVEVNRYLSLYGWSISNFTIQQLNSNQRYTNIDPDISRQQLNIVGQQSILQTIYRSRNLYDNQVVFLDVKWRGFLDGRRKNIDNWLPDIIGYIYANGEKGFIYRAGTISIESTNYINDMIYLSTSPGAYYNPNRR